MDEAAETEPSKVSFSDYDLELAAEYRAIGYDAKGLDSHNQSASLIEHRLRLGTRLVNPDQIALVWSVDLLDGALWGRAGGGAGDPLWWMGDQGELGRAGVGYAGAGDPRDPSRYTLAFVPAEPAIVRHLYGQLPTPWGVIRIGRQPLAEGNSILYADGAGTPNRFGHGTTGVFADGMSITTDVHGRFDAVSQATADRGLFLTGFAHRLAAAPALVADGVGRVGGRIRLLEPLPTTQQFFDALAEVSYGWRTRGTETVTLRGALEVRSADFTGGGEAFYVTGRTDELSASWGVLRSEAPAQQRIEQWGARAVARWDAPHWTGYFELDYASSDANPSVQSSLTRAYFAADARVGLLLFPHVLAFQSARSRAAAVAALAAVGAPTDAAWRVGSEGSFTNAVALFPQLDLKPLANLLLRWGVLVAWTPEGLVDPVMSSTPGAEGRRLNYRGGRPGHLYGVEVDGRLRWQASPHGILDLEGALLEPGDALEDAHGHASVSALGQVRATFVF